MKKILAVLGATLALAGVASTTAQAQSSRVCRLGVYVGWDYYTGTVGASSRTSCPFARNVFKASVTFIVRHGGAGDGDFYVRVYSPVTWKWYRTHCWANGDIRSWRGIHVDCRAGVGARVVFTAYKN